MLYALYNVLGCVSVSNSNARENTTKKKKIYFSIYIWSTKCTVQRVVHKMNCAIKQARAEGTAIGHTSYTTEDGLMKFAAQNKSKTTSCVNHSCYLRS